ncbi:HFL329Wp [Eremothecium sinecaudum]|uniref:HFL329Wp n=1 Tax=Eremothecium sinecaudum TaxID=45286 RepID=A0A109UZM0_9SACH|nr:HFL329Wp [Eremothecium sinecaudum]AMD21527.1 HFL329Wp [Eremothecium sinecaudum]
MNLEVGELSTVTSEQFGFKPLFSKQLVNSYNESLPFKKLNCLQINSAYKTFIACGAGEVVTGQLKELQQFGEGAETNFTRHKVNSGVLAVGFAADSTVYATLTGELWSKSLRANDEWKLLDVGLPGAITAMKCFACYVFACVEGSNELYRVQLPQKTTLKIAEGICDFDVLEGNLIYIQKNYTIVQVKTLNPTSVVRKFQVPENLREDDKRPIALSYLSQEQVFLVLGIPTEAEEVDVQYSHSMYVCSLSQKSIQESFDLVPAFSTVNRNPIYYHSTLYDFTPDTKRLHIMASSCSSELSLMNDTEVIQPLQDSDGAVLPVNPDTENDTNALGLAIDVVTKTQVLEPCEGVDSTTELPAIYVLTNLGVLQCWSLFHKGALKSGTLSLKETTARLTNEQSTDQLKSGEHATELQPTSLLKETDSIRSTTSKPIHGSGGYSANFAAPSPFSSLASSTASPIDKDNSGKQAFASTPFSGAGKESPFATLSKNPTSASALPGFGQTSFALPDSKGSSLAPNQSVGTGTPAFGKPAFGKPSFGSMTANSEPSAFGKSSFGSPTTAATTASAFGKPSFGFQMNSSEPAFGKPAFGSQPPTTQSPFGKLSNAPSSKNTTVELGTPTSGASVFGKPSFGMSTSSIDSSFAKPSFGTATSSTDSPFGKPSFGTDTAATDSPFGKPAFGTATTATDSPFGKPSFGTANDSPFGKSPLQQNTSSSLFGKSFNSMGTASPFSVLKGSEENSQQSTTKDHTIASNHDTSNKDDKKLDSNASPFSVLDIASTSDKSDGQSSDMKVSSSNKNSDINSNEEKMEDDGKQSSSSLANLASSPESLERQSSDAKINSSTNDSTENQVAMKHGEPLSINSLTARIKKAANISSSEISNSVVKDDSPEGKNTASFSFAEFSNSLKPESSMKHAPALSFDLMKSKLRDYDSENDSDSSEDAESASDSEDDDDERSVGNSDEADITTADDIEKTAAFVNEEVTSFVSKPKGNLVKSSLPNELEKNKQPYFAEKTPERTVQQESLQGGSSATNQQIAVPKSETQTPQPSPIGQEHMTSGKSSNWNTEPKFQKLPDTDDIPSTMSTPEFLNSAPKLSPQRTLSKQPVIPTPSKTDIQQQCPKTDNGSNEDMNSLEQSSSPVPMKSFYIGADTKKVKLVSKNPIVNSMEKTYHYIEAEIEVLQENLTNLGEFIDDQSKIPYEKSLKSLNCIPSWRLSEVQRLIKIMTDNANELKQHQDKVRNLDNESNIDCKTMEKMQTMLRDYYLHLEYFNKECDNDLRNISLPQITMQTKLRSKLAKVNDWLRTILELLQLMKLYTIKDKAENMAIVRKLVNDSIERGTLLENIQSLRNDISKLSEDKSKRGLPSDKSLQPSLTSGPIVKKSMEINVRKQLGLFFKSQIK